jgi:hypothetical protein
MTFVYLSALALGVGTIAACGNSSGSAGSATCSSQGKCLGDKPQTANDMNMCAASLADPTCGAKYQTVINCFFAKEVCAADGGADSFRTLGACAAEFAAYFSCQSTKDGGGGD